VRANFLRVQSAASGKVRSRLRLAGHGSGGARIWRGKDNVDGVHPHGMERPNYMNCMGLVFHGVQRFLGNRDSCGAMLEFGTRSLGMRCAPGSTNGCAARTTSTATCAPASKTT